MYITVSGHDPFFINARYIYIYVYILYILYIYNTPTAKIDGQKKTKGKLNLRWDFSLFQSVSRFSRFGSSTILLGPNRSNVFGTHVAYVTEPAWS